VDAGAVAVVDGVDDVVGAEADVEVEGVGADGGVDDVLAGGVEVGAQEGAAAAVEVGDAEEVTVLLEDGVVERAGDDAAVAAVEGDVVERARGGRL
jgi:hypothetical protein